MGEQVTISGTVQAGPSQVSDNPFPSGTTSIPFQLLQSPKQYNVDSGKNVGNFNSPSAFVALGGLSATIGPVTQGHTLYLRSNAPFTVRETTVVPSASDNVVSYPVNGLLIKEFPADHYLKLLEVQGQGFVEWYIAGNQ